MSFIYKNPNIGNTLSEPNVVTRSAVIGTNYSVLETGGYREVWGLKDLNFQTFGGSGTIENSGNTIPINYQKSNLGFIPSKVTIDEDGISSGRRRLGMQVYVHETNLVYQYFIDNYEQLFNAASGSTQEVASKYIVSDNTTPGLAFVNAWLDSSIEGVSGVTRTNARWRIFYGTDITVTGGTYSDGTATFTNSTGGTFNVTGFLTGSTGSQNLQQVLDYGNISSTGMYISGATLSASTVDINGGYIDGVILGSVIPVTLTSNSATITSGFINGVVLGNTTPVTLTSNSATITGGFINGVVLGNTTPVTLTSNSATITGGFINGVTLGNTTPVIITSNSATITGGFINGTAIGTSNRSTGGFTYIYDNNGSTGTTGQILSTTGGGIEWTDSSSTDYYVTGGTYSSGTTTLTLTRNDGNDVVISGFATQETDTYLTGATYTPTTLTLGMSDDTEFTVTGFAPEITGGTYNTGTLSLLDNTGGSVNITGITFTSTNIYNTDGQLEGNRVIDQDSNSLRFSGGSVSMGTTLQSPVCALLELASTNQGLLIPRMTQVQRLAVNTPLPGLLLFCTDSDSNGAEGLYMYKSQGWVNVL